MATVKVNVQYRAVIIDDYIDDQASASTTRLFTEATQWFVSEFMLATRRDPQVLSFQIFIVHDDPVDFEDIKSNGSCRWNKDIYIYTLDRDVQATVRTLFHELTHWYQMYCGLNLSEYLGDRERWEEEANLGRSVAWDSLDDSLFDLMFDTPWPL
jgi:hypothetical protein